ncbi:MAG TPA: hypothetical protein VGP55_02150 [Chitinophagaceae bacterium]|nr:hypothetical protein [Chitinophagaceae bacterium]
MSLNDIEVPANKIKWRQHEIILITLTALISLTGRLWYLYHTSTDQFESPFIQTNTPFNLYKNVLLPDISVGLASYLVYLWFSLYTIPRLLFPKKFEAGTSKISLSFLKIKLQGFAKKILKEYAWLFIEIILVIFVLGSVLNIVIYYRHQGLFIILNFQSSSIRII